MRKFVSFLAFTVLIFSISYSINVPTDGLYGHWTMDNRSGSTLIDDSGKGNSLAMNGSVQLDQTGYEGFSIGFPTQDENNYFYINDANQNGLDGMSNITVGAWVLCNLSSGGRGAVLSKWTSGVEENASYLLTRESDDRMYFLVTNGSGRGVYQYARTGGAFPTGSWTHIAGVGQIGRFLVFVNGSSAGSTTSGPYPGSIGNSPCPFMLGRLTIDFDEWPAHDRLRWRGFIDDTCVYNRALSDVEISYLMSGAPVPTATNTPAPTNTPNTPSAGVNSSTWLEYK